MDPTIPIQLPIMVEDKTELLKTPLHGVYIPCALIVFGVAIHDYHFIPHTLLVLGLFVGIRLLIAYNKRASIQSDKWNDFELIDKTVVSKNSAIYRFKLYRDEEILDIPVGHHLACQINVDGKNEVRYYTPISSQFDQGFFDILVKSYKDGSVSKAFASLNQGQTVKFKGPVGRMSYKNNMASEIGMIAGGSGITPILQVLSYITTTPEDTTRINLLFANEYENDILLRDEIDELARIYPFFDVHYTLTHPPENWDGDVGYVTKEMIEKYLPPPTKTSKIFISGPLEMKKLCLELTEELGFDKGKLNSDQNDQVFCF